MNLQQVWKTTLPALDLAPQQRQFAASLDLVKVRGDTMRFETRQPVTQSNADKLAYALYQQINDSINVIITQKPSGTTVRGYRLKGDSIHDRR